jgi:hypothetical protein
MLHSREASAFSKSWKNEVKRRFKPASTNFAACHISLQKAALPSTTLTTTCTYTIEASKLSSIHRANHLKSTPTIAAPSASLFASSLPIKIIILHHQLALHCLQCICTNPSLPFHHSISLRLNPRKVYSFANTLTASTSIMANIKGPTLAKSSPYSSDEASHHDTPSTSLTAFSPESASAATAPRLKFNVELAEAGSTNFNLGTNVGTL